MTHDVFLLRWPGVMQDFNCVSGAIVVRASVFRPADEQGRVQGRWRTCGDGMEISPTQRSRDRHASAEDPCLRRDEPMAVTGYHRRNLRPVKGSPGNFRPILRLPEPDRP